jgi:hypothetical protein
MFSDGWRSGKGATEANPHTQAGPSQIPVDEEGFPFDAGDGPSGCTSFDSEGDATGVTDCAQTDLSKAFDEDRTDFAITARIDWKLEGLWSQMDDFTAGVGADSAIFIGAAIHYEVGETGDTAYNNNFLIWTVDASFETEGWNFYAAIMGLSTDLDKESSVLADDRDLFGVIVQGGYRIPDSTWEPFVRWEYIDWDDAFSDAFGDDYDSTSLITFGVNNYIHGHDVKMSIDVVYALDPIPVSDGGLGLQADAQGDDDQIVIRAQFQLLF